MSETFQFSLNAIRFEDVRAEVVRYLSENGTYDAPLDFEGSNLAYVIDTMAYTTMLMSYMVSTVANDNFLDTTTLRKNAVSISKTLGYKPKRIQASILEGVFTYNPGDQIFDENSKLIIPPNTVFEGVDKGQTWINIDPIYLLVNPKNPFELTSAADDTTPRISLIQGTYKKFSVFGTGKSLQAFTIPSTQIDENNMKVSVYTTQSGEATKVEWVHAKTFYNIKNEEIYFVEEDILNEGTPKIIFGNGIVGRMPSNTETILVDYIETLGPEGNGESDINIPSTLPINMSYDITSVDISKLEFEPSGLSFSGQDYETLESIKSNAPRFFAAAGRAITGNDYETLIKDDFGYIVDEVNVIGGDELEPGNRGFLGNAYISVIPKGINDNLNFTDSLQLYLTESKEIEIINALRDSGVIATKKYFLKPSYLYLNIQPTIEVSSKLTALELKETTEEAYNILINYFNEDFRGFETPYRESKVRSQVDVLETVISTKIETDYNFVLNKDSFYVDRETVLWLPVVFQKEDGVIIRNDWNNLPLTTNFVKKNSQIIEDLNAGNQSIIDLIHVTVNGPLPEDVDVEVITPVWHGRDVSGLYTDHFWMVTVDRTMTLTPDPNVIGRWIIHLNSQDNMRMYEIGEILFYSDRSIVINDFDTYSYDSNGDTILDTTVDINEFLRNNVEVNTEFDVLDADPINNLDYLSIRFRRKFNKYNLIPERINQKLVGRTAIHGKLTHQDLDRYLFNYDVYTFNIGKINVLDDGVSKSLIQTTYQFDGQGSNHYTVSITRTASTATDAEYNIYLNNTLSDEKQRVAIIEWDKTLSGLDQFNIYTVEEEIAWITEQGFEAKEKGFIGTNKIYEVITLELDEHDNYLLNITFKTAISAIKAREKNILGVFEFDDTQPVGSKYVFYDFYTKSFTDSSLTKIPLSFEDEIDNTVEIQISAKWNGDNLFDIKNNTDGVVGFRGDLNESGSVTLNDLGLREEVFIEPFEFLTTNSLGEVETRNGYAIYSYGVFHNVDLGFFEYETGKTNFNRTVVGNKNAAGSLVNKTEIHIREFFDNYGILEDDVKMDVITMLPENEYDDVDGFQTISGSLTDFDSIYTQTVRTKINNVEAIQI